MAHWDNENFNTQEPPNDVMCTTCKFRMKPFTIMGKIIDRSKYGKCDQFESKPQNVLWEKALCPKYQQETL